MAKPRIFISSTFYDLKQIRADLHTVIQELGYEVIRNEEGTIPYGKDKPLEEYCYKEIESVDILVAIIGGRYGSQSKEEQYSITQMEIQMALEQNKQVYIFIEESVASEYETYCLNKENEKVKYRYVDDIRIFEFIEKVKALPNNNPIFNFKTSQEIAKYLKKQWAGLFQGFLKSSARIKEVNLVKDLVATTKTLNELVSFLRKENDGQKQIIEKILLNNHPLFREIVKTFNIKYNVYFSSFEEIDAWLAERGFIFRKNDNKNRWNKKIRNKEHIIEISKEIFDDNNKLKLLTDTEWESNYFETRVEEEEEEDLPF